MREILFTKTDERAKVPTQAYHGDAGWDLFALEDTRISTGIPTDIRTGVAVAIPDGFYGRIVHRSSAPRKKGIMVLEGIIDSGFRGELFACAYTWLIPSDVFPSGEGAMNVIKTVHAGESIAQLIIQRVEPMRFVERKELPSSERGEKGFGSSGN